jgi:hypothetical protein
MPARDEASSSKKPQIAANATLDIATLDNDSQSGHL